MAQIIRLKHGLAAGLPTAGLNTGEVLVTSDELNAYFSVDATTLKTLTPAVASLPALLGTELDNATDFLMVHDASATGQKEKKMSIAEFKSTFAAASDEKVGATALGTPGYLMGTNGLDGVLRAGSGLSFTLDVTEDFVTLNLTEIDGGTF